MPTKAKKVKRSDIKQGKTLWRIIAGGRYGEGYALFRLRVLDRVNQKNIFHAKWFNTNFEYNGKKADMGKTAIPFPVIHLFSTRKAAERELVKLNKK